MRESSWRNYEDADIPEDDEDDEDEPPMGANWDSELWQDRDDDELGGLKKMSKQKAWGVYVPTPHKKTGVIWLTRIDTVFYDESVSIETVVNGLIDHDGYPSNIKVIEVSP